MEIHQLRYFVAAAEAGSISRAADRCHVAQPSLSQQIKKLEQAVGMPLFDRLGRGVALTDAGRALLPRARRILSEIRDAEALLASDIDAGVGRISIGAIPTMAPYLMPALLRDLRDEFPAAEITVREGFTEDLVERLADNEITAAIVSTPILHDLIELEVVGEEPLIVVAPADHAAREPGAITVAELRGLPRVSLHNLHCLARQVTEFCNARRVGLNVVCHTTQLATVLEFVRLGIGVSLVPYMAAAHDTSTDRQYLRLKRSEPRREIAIAWRAGRAPSRVIERLIEMARTLIEATNARQPGEGVT